MVKVFVLEFETESPFIVVTNDNIDASSFPASMSVTEITHENAKKIFTDRASLEANLQCIVRDVLATIGIRMVRNPTPETENAAPTN
jgi:hypothetical protein